MFCVILGYMMREFVNISVGVYRDLRPSDVTEMIEEMKADGISTENNEDVANEMCKADHWSTIGIGTAGYYRKNMHRRARR